MVTKPTGRPRGRPRKQQPPSAKRGRGRPKLTLADDPQRYLVALLQAHVDCGRLQGLSERRVAENIFALHDGRVLDAPENIAAALRGDPFEMVPSRHRANRDHGTDWRDGNDFRPGADALRGKMRAARKDPMIDPNARWLAAMSIVWVTAMQGYGELEDFAAYLAASVGEMEYYEDMVRPVLIDRWRQRQSGRERAEYTLPDLMRIFSPKRTAADAPSVMTGGASRAAHGTKANAQDAPQRPKEPTASRQRPRTRPRR